MTDREQAIAAIDAAEKALTWTTSRGYWIPVRDYSTGRRGLVKHQQTNDDLAEFVYPADAEHACLWHPRRVKALIDRDRATLERHKPDPTYSDGGCPCGWAGDQCPEANAVIAFWTSTDLPDITDTRAVVSEITASTNAAVIGEDLIYLLGRYPDIDLTTVRLSLAPSDEDGDHVRIEARRNGTDELCTSSRA